MIGPEVPSVSDKVGIPWGSSDTASGTGDGTGAGTGAGASLSAC